MFLLLIGFVRFIRFNRLYTKPYPNPTVFIKLYPFGLYGIYQNQTILSISVRFGSVRFGFTKLNSPTKKYPKIVFQTIVVSLLRFYKRKK